MKSLQLNIQFLRAISVILVFFYHLKIEFFKFGYLGVDIFFVISGYVITSRLFDELIKTNKIKFTEFYTRRIKRIFPVLIFVLTIVLIFIVLFQPLDLFIGNIIVYIFTIFGLSNFYYLFSKKDYFDNVFEDVFGHTWSLGVEEQFYFIFPLFLYFLYKVFSKRQSQILILFSIILLGIFITFKYSENIQLVFYSPIFRFWEFLLGCLVFFIKRNLKIKNSILSSFCFFILIIFILLGLYPSNFYAILFSTFLASGFIIFYEKNKSVNFLYENKLIVYLGNISYSFYLWHLPVIYFYDLYFGNFFIKAPIAFFISILLSMFSYKYIESKFRNKNFKNIKKTTYVPIFSSIFIIFISLIFITFQKSDENNLKKSLKKFVYNINYLERKLNYSNRVIFYKINISGNEIYKYCTQESFKFKLNNNDLRSECLKDGKYKKRLFFIEGNSHTANYIPMFNNLDLNPGDSFYYSHNSDILSDKTINKISDLKNIYDEIVFVTNIENYNLYNLENIKIKTDKDIKILILSTIPNLENGREPLKCFIRGTDCTYSKINDFKNRDLNNYFNHIREFISKTSNNRILFYNSYDTICPKSPCYSYNVEKDKLSHRDKSHLTIEGSLLLKKEFLKFYKINYK